MNDKFYLPKKIKAGFQKRSGTYTGKLAYVIYYDDKNVLRKETSWNSWRNKEIDPLDIDNVPTEGFVLNKNVGGYKSDWNFRNAYIRVYDPRGFEFEITLPNLLYILQECTSTKGKGLEGEFVYSWDGKDLFLLPVHSEIYRNSIKFTELSEKKISARDLKVGHTYIDKNSTQYLYLGRFDWHYSDFEYDTGIRIRKFFKKREHVFYSYDKELTEDYRIRLVSVSTLREEISTTPPENFAEIVQKFSTSKHASRPKRVHLKKVIVKAEEKFDLRKQNVGTFAREANTKKFRLVTVVRNRTKSIEDFNELRIRSEDTVIPELDSPEPKLEYYSNRPIHYYQDTLLSNEDTKLFEPFLIYENGYSERI